MTGRARLLGSASCLCLLLAGVAAPRGAWAQASAGSGADSGPASSTGPGNDASSGGDTYTAPPGLPAPADTVLPRVGIDDSVPDLRDHLLDSFGTPPAREAAGTVARSGLQIGKQIAVSEEFTDNAGQFGVGGGGRSGSGYDFITLITPSVTITDQTQRLQVNLNYSPTGEIYARNSSYSQFEQQASGDILATAVPNWLYVDLRGSIGQQSVYGGYGGGTVSALGPDDRETVTSVSISPYVTHSFGTVGTMQAGVGYIYSATDAPGSAQGGLPLGPFGFGQGNYGSSYLGTERAFASFTTGEDLGRLRDRVGVDANFYSGSGALRNARRITVTDDASYAINRLVAVLGQIGYEDLAYPASDFSYSGPIGAGGVRITPNRASTVVLEYRYVDGFASPLVEASVQATPRIHIFGSYSEGISTEEQDQQDTLLSGTDDLTGAPVSATVAAPLLGTSSAFGANQNLYKIKRLDATLTWLGDLDTVALSVQHEETTPVGRTLFGELNAPTSGTFGSISWRREISPNTGVSASVSYGSNDTALFIGGGQTASSDTVSYSVGIDRVFTPTISAYARVGGTYVISGYDNLGGQNGNEDYVVVGAVKRF